MSAAGRSVVASAPALGAGDREFESPRPDHAVRPRALPLLPVPRPMSARLRCPVHSPRSPPTVKSDRRDPEPDPGQAHRRGARSRSSSRASTRRTRRSARRSRIPGFRKGKVPPRVIDQRVRPRRGARGGRQRRAARSSTARRVEANDVNAARPARGRRHRARRRRAADLHRRGRRPAGDRRCPTTTGIEVTVDDAEVTDAEVDEQLDGLRERFATLTGVERAAADGDFVSIDLSAAVDGEAVDGRSPPRACRYQVGQAVAARRPRRGDHRAGRGRDGRLPDHAGRRRPRRRGGRRHRRR